MDSLDPAALDVLGRLVDGHPHLAAALAVLGLVRLCVKPVVASLHAWAERSGRPKDAELLARIEASPGYQMFLFLLDWFCSIKPRR